MDFDGTEKGRGRARQNAAGRPRPAPPSAGAAGFSAGARESGTDNLESTWEALRIPKSRQKRAGAGGGADARRGGGRTAGANAAGAKKASASPGTPRGSKPRAATPAARTRPGAASSQPGVRAKRQVRPQKTAAAARKNAAPGAKKSPRQPRPGGSQNRWLKWVTPAQPLAQLPRLEAIAWVLAWAAVVLVVLALITFPFWKDLLSSSKKSTTSQVQPTMEVPYLVYRCEAKNLTQNVTPEAPAQDFGQAQKFTVTLKNNGTFACNLESGAADIGVLVKTGEQTIFDSRQCGGGTEGPASILLAPQSTYQREITWDGHKFNADCKAGDFASPGTYQVSPTFTKLESDASSQFLIK